MIDEGHLPREQLEPLDSPVAGIFQLEQSKGLEEIRRIIGTLIEVLDDPDLRELQRDLTTFTHRAILPTRFPGEQIPELRDLQETQIMLAERAATWPKQWMAEGYEKGREAGRSEGWLDGQRLALSRLAEAKFGALESRHQIAIAEASKDQLHQWFEDVLTADEPGELFHG